MPFITVCPTVSRSWLVAGLARSRRHARAIRLEPDDFAACSSEHQLTDDPSGSGTPTEAAGGSKTERIETRAFQRPPALAIVNGVVRTGRAYSYERCAFCTGHVRDDRTITGKTLQWFPGSAAIAGHRKVVAGLVLFRVIAANDNPVPRVAERHGKDSGRRSCPERSLCDLPRAAPIICPQHAGSCAGAGADPRVGLSEYGNVGATGRKRAFISE